MKRKLFLSFGGLGILMILGLFFLFPRKIEHGMQNLKKETIITKQDDGKEIGLKKGEFFQVELEGAGATGYWWHIDDLDGEHLQSVSEDTRVNNDQQKAGAPVMGIWKFKVLKTGKTSVKMDYYRSWEGIGSAIDYFTINLLIK